MQHLDARVGGEQPPGPAVAQQPQPRRLALGADAAVEGAGAGDGVVVSGRQPMTSGTTSQHQAATRIAAARSSSTPVRAMRGSET
jgi:hypothetical protein